VFLICGQKRLLLPSLNSSFISFLCISSSAIPIVKQEMSLSTGSVTCRFRFVGLQHYVSFHLKFELPLPAHPNFHGEIRSFVPCDSSEDGNSPLQTLPYMLKLDCLSPTRNTPSFLATSFIIAHLKNGIRIPEWVWGRRQAN
jgi:hypothetical protein